MKQQLSIMDKWLTKTERKMKKDEQIGHNYETTKKQLDEHQVINDKLEKPAGIIKFCSSR